MIGWNHILERLRSLSPTAHELRAPCALNRIKDVELKLGPLPGDLSEMLLHFNGGKLFIKTMEMITLFGLLTPGDPPLEQYDWYVDIWTPAWRSKMIEPTDWVIGMFNYGSVAVLDKDSLVREWDSSQQKWVSDRRPYAEWLNGVIADGTAYLNET